LETDVFEPQGWKHIEDSQFNFIFSDGFHSGDAVWTEFQRWTELNIFNKTEFIIWYDDIDSGNIQDYFCKIAVEMQDRYGLTDDNVLIFKVNGWMGKNEFQHTNAIITNKSLRKLFPFLFVE